MGKKEKAWPTANTHGCTLARVLQTQAAGMACCPPANQNRSKTKTTRQMTEPNAVRNAISYAKFRSRSRRVVIRVYDDAGNVIETHEQPGDFRNPIGQWTS